MTKSYIAFGSNKGDKISHISKAIELISENEKTEVKQISSLYETLPYGDVPQDNFLNGVLLLTTDYNLNELFVFLKSVEKKVGRTPSERWGPREIDLDILTFGNVVQSEGEVIVPHIGITKRDFVIQPLLELDEEIVLPGFESKLKKLDLSEIEKNIINKLSHKITY
ncbi:MAG: 2-amino-4-hydroxy-6-hydroxymethyldihydropteridine diphosphokinase [Rhodothermaceae bacterium]